MFALIDCNNFYVSCERAFQPQLQNRAGVVLSNNDGCAIARSQEAKDLGVKMGAPYFKLRETHKEVWVRSSNYALYHDMMLRVTSIIRSFFPDQEIYSIDECFCDLAGYDYLDPEQLAIELRSEILKCTGIPVCIGVARTKTLAKIANRIAKKKTDNGVYFLNKENEETALKGTEIGDVWGIGKQHAKRLVAMGVINAYQFSKLPASFVQKQMTIVGLRMWRELRGESCIPMEYFREAKKGIGTSRSFGRPETDLNVMLEAVATYASIAALKLRNQNSVCGKVEVYTHTSRFIPDPDKYFSAAMDIKLPTPTSSTAELIKIAKYLLKKIFKQGYRYQKVGIMLGDIRPDDQVQQSLFDKNTETRSKMIDALKAMDRLNQLNGRDTVRIAASGYERKWTIKQNFLSRKYTTDIREVMIVNAK